jgi:hypothetical protein
VRDDRRSSHSTVVIWFCALGGLLVLLNLLRPSALGYASLAIVVVVGRLAAIEDGRRRRSLPL